jgi:hypothetical protein
VIAQALQPFDEAPSGVFRLQPIEKVSPGIAVRLPALDDERLVEMQNG